ncbi:MAG: dihydroorotate dehydrogenase-like protein [Spirochaetales bacterium]|nr:dihydroorotate dehydrogenase-like protein [Spirochaetales bacterium]
MDLKTQYMGLELKNPVVVSASGLTSSADGVKKAIEAGAGAVVLNSLFEEDIAAAVGDAGVTTASIHPEAEVYAKHMGMLLQPDSYLELVERSVGEVPVIASLNCYSKKWWVDYAQRLENVGANALELNLAPMALDSRTTAAKLEDELVEMVYLAREAVTLPLSVKIGHSFTSLPHLATRLESAGANSLTLFNRYYNVDIDIENVSFQSGNSLSSPQEFGPVLRWVGILSDTVEMDVAASTGLDGAKELIKALLAGANVGQFCSTLYRNGLKQIGVILDELSEWMENHGYENISDFYSLLSLNDDQRDAFYHRLQYVKALKGKR